MHPIIFIQPAVSCRHSRTFVFGEFLVPELDARDVEKIGMLLRAVWPDFGLRISSSGDIEIFTQRGRAEDVVTNKSVQYLADDLEFRLEVIQEADSDNDRPSVRVNFASPIRWETAQELLLMPPRLGISSRELRRRSSSSLSSECSDASASTKKYFESPYSVSIGTGKFGIICPRCAEKCSIEVQLSQVKHFPTSLEIPVLSADQLLDPPPEEIPCKRTGTASTVSNVSQLYSDNNKKSEAVQSLDSVGGRSETSFVPSVLERRASCPSAILSFSREEPLMHRKLLTLCSTQHIRDDHVNKSMRSETEERKERIKQSLSRLSASMASRCSGDALSESSVTSSHILQMSTRSKRNSVIIPETVVENPPCDSPTKSTSKLDQSDLLSPVSSISVREENIAPSNVSGGFGTLRIHGNPPPPPAATAVFPACGKPPVAPRAATYQETGHVSQLGGKTTPTFVPTPLGRELMAIYSSGTPQKVLWDTFMMKAKSPIEFTDSGLKMPSLVFALRGLIRHGDGDYGATRTDTIPVLFHILTFRHPVCETSAALEAVECSAAILALLAVSPVSRHSNRPTDLLPRDRFDPILLAQNGILFQQVILVLSQQVTRWISLETSRDPTLPFTNRAVSALLDVVVLYGNPRLRTVWLASAPGHLKQNVGVLLVSLADRLPTQLIKCVVILDLLLDHLSMDRETIHRIAQTLHAGIQKIAQTSPGVAAEASQVINKWSNASLSSLNKKRSMSLSNLFGLGKSKTSLSLKSAVYNEYRSL